MPGLGKTIHVEEYGLRDCLCRLLMRLVNEPDKALVVITELVATEWHQNIAEIRDNAIRFLSQVDGIVHRSYQAAIPAGIALPRLC